MTQPRKPSVKLVHGQAITTSLKVAEAFGKQHKAVLRTIANLECTKEFNRRNFAPTEYTDSANRKQPMYTITRDGFAFLASGFTGKEAAQWKEKYIAAFNELERRALDKAATRRLPKASPAPRQAVPPPCLPSRARFLMCFEEGRWLPPIEVPYRAHVISKDEMLERIRQGDEHFDKNFVSEIAGACADRFLAEFGSMPRLPGKVAQP